MSRQDVRDAFAAAIRSTLPGIDVYTTRLSDARLPSRFFCVYMGGGDIRLTLGGATREERPDVFVMYAQLAATDEELDAVMEQAHAAIMASTTMGRPLLTRFDYDEQGESHLALVYQYSTII